MAINWPEDRGQKTPRRKPRAAAWGHGEVRLSDDELWGDGSRQRLTGGQLTALVIVIAVLIAVGLAIWLFGPLPRLLPLDCNGCFVPSP